MMKWLGAVLLPLMILTIQACAPAAQEDCGFVQNVYGERISWQSNVPVKMYLHEDIPESMVPAIVSAADSWGRTAGRPLFEIVTSNRYHGPIKPHQDGVNVIYLMKNWETDRTNEQGRTSVYWVGDLIKEADIRLNAADFSYYWENQNLSGASNSNKSSTDPVNFEALVLHELGHVLGLKHKDGEGSVMATYLASRDDRTAVSNTDVTDLKCEY